MYHNMDDLIEVCVGHMANEQFTGEQVRTYLADMLPKLSYWREQKNLAGAEEFEAFKQDLIDEINALNVAGSCMSPCAMLLAGFMMGKFPLKDLLTGWRPYVYSAIRLIVVPVIFGAVLLLCGMKNQYLMLPLLVAGIPLGLNLVVYPESQGHEKQASENAKLCFVSYILALAVLPCTFAVLTYLVG